MTTDASRQPRRAPVFGPEPWRTLAGAEWCHFDRWFALVVDADFGGDLERLEAEMVTRLRSSLNGRRDAEAKLSHLTDLRHRLAAAGIGVGDLVAAERPDKAVLAKARRKVGEQSLEERAMTSAMVETPRARLQRRARFGHWERFPADPTLWHSRLTGRRKATFATKGRSFDVARRLRERLAALETRCRSEADRLSLYRAFHTRALVVADHTDDSYGVIGELRLGAFTGYLRLDWQGAGMAPDDWWQDLCELLVWEPYALTHQHETLPFKRLTKEHADLVERILLDLAEEHRAVHLDYEADEALQLVAWAAIAARRYGRYAEAARRLGSDHWMPVVALAESAARSRRQGLALEVFRAADRPGWHQDFLRRRCLELTGVTLDDAPRSQRAVRERH